MSSTSLHSLVRQTVALGGLFAAITALLFGRPSGLRTTPTPSASTARKVGSPTFSYSLPRTWSAGEEAGTKDLPEEIVAITNGEADRLVIIFCVRRLLSTPPLSRGSISSPTRLTRDFHSANEASFLKDDPNWRA